MLTESSKQPYIFIMFGWFKNICIFTYRVNWSVIYYSCNSFFSIIFRAHINPVDFYRAKKTRPYLPWPSYFILVKLLTVIFFLVVGRNSFNGSKFLLISKVGSTIILLFKSFFPLFKKEGTVLLGSFRLYCDFYPLSISLFL